ncbi:MAG: hypothetical protein KDD82_11795, partial [Planctomycetes bacterium]|nr:hypothetical protein [Planctomycetota bacterium]
MLSLVLQRLRRRLRRVDSLEAFLRWGSWGGLLGVGLAAWRPSQPVWHYALPSLACGLIAAGAAWARRRPDALLAELADEALGAGALFRTALEVPEGSRWGGPVHVSAMEAGRGLAPRRAI